MNTVFAIVVTFLGAQCYGAYIPREAIQCNDFTSVMKVWENCKETMTWHSLEEPLAFAKETCRNKGLLLACMREAVTSCDNVEKIMCAVEHTLDYCDGNNVTATYESYMTKKFEKAEGRCMGKLFASETFACINYVYDRHLNKLSWQEGLIHLKSMWSEIIRCSARFLALDSVEECDGRSGIKATADIMAELIQWNMIGTDMYTRFLEIYGDVTVS